MINYISYAEKGVCEIKTSCCCCYFYNFRGGFNKIRDADGMFTLESIAPELLSIFSRIYTRIRIKHLSMTLMRGLLANPTSKTFTIRFPA